MIISRRPLLLGAVAASLMAGSAAAQTAGFDGEWFGALDLDRRSAPRRRGGRQRLSTPGQLVLALRMKPGMSASQRC